MIAKSQNLSITKLMERNAFFVVSVIVLTMSQNPCHHRSY
jgi:hypothetical protein